MISEIFSKVRGFFDKSKTKVEEVKVEIPVEKVTAVEEKPIAEEVLATEEEKPVVKSSAKKVSKKVTNKTK